MSNKSLSYDSIPITIGSFSSYSYSTDSANKSIINSKKITRTKTRKNENTEISLHINIDKVKRAIFVFLCIIVLCVTTSIILVVLYFVEKIPNKYGDYIWSALLVSLVLSFCGCGCVGYICEINNNRQFITESNVSNESNESDIYTKFLQQIEETSV